MAQVDGLVRIGELGRRLGVGPDRLRAWERRYGLLAPVRTAGGFRLYSGADERRARAMLDQLGRGLSAAEAAAVVLAAQRPPRPEGPVEDLRGRLADALAAFDAPGANAVLDQLFAHSGPEAAMRDVIFPYLRALGEAWQRGEVHVGQEHFASHLIESRLLALVPGWDRGKGRRAVLACAPGEQHSLALVGHGIALRNRRWRVTYLGADTPLDVLARTVEALEPELVVVSATMPEGLARCEVELRALAASARLVLAGAGVSAELAGSVGAEFLDADPVTAAERLDG